MQKESNQTAVIVIILLIIVAGTGYTFYGKSTDQKQVTTGVANDSNIEATTPFATTTTNTAPKVTSGSPTVTGATQGGGIKGLVLIGPTCPVQRNPPDPKCADKPYGTKLMITLLNNPKSVKEFSSGSDGKFIVDIKPGEYQIKSVPSSAIYPKCYSVSTVKVIAHSYTATKVTCDTGMR